MVFNENGAVAARSGKPMSWHRTCMIMLTSRRFVCPKQPVAPIVELLALVRDQDNCCGAGRAMLRADLDGVLASASREDVLVRFVFVAWPLRAENTGNLTPYTAWPLQHTC